MILNILWIQQIAKATDWSGVWIWYVVKTSLVLSVGLEENVLGYWKTHIIWSGNNFVAWIIAIFPDELSLSFSENKSEIQARPLTAIIKIKHVIQALGFHSNDHFR